MKILVGFDIEFYPEVKVFESLGELTSLKYDREYLENNIDKFDIIVPHLFENIDNNLINRAKNLKILATPTTGSDHLDLITLQSKKIEFISLNDDRNFIDEISSTAELAWFLILSCVRKSRELNKRVFEDQSWINNDIRGYELKNKTLGIIGYGRLGKLVAKYGQCFGMKVLAYDINEEQYDDNIQQVSLNELLVQSDVISLHPKLTPSAKEMINKNTIEKMKQGVVLVNTARGGVVNSYDLIEGLESGKIATLGMDVFNGEYNSSLPPTDPLIERAKHDLRIIVTPHVGGATVDAHSKVFYKICELIDKKLQLN